MIGKIITGKSFAGCIGYLLAKEGAEIIDSLGVRRSAVRDTVGDFNAQRKMNPEVSRAVGHIILSWSKEDLHRLDSGLMKDRACEYLRQMKIENTQYLLVRHNDREHPHVHIVYNRINNEGKTISDRFQKKKNVQVCKAITLRYGYRLGVGKNQVKREQLKGRDKVKYELYDTLLKLSGQARSWIELERELQKEGIAVQFKYLSGTSTLQGVSFSKNGLTFKGSSIDRSLSYGKLTEKLEKNNKQDALLLTPRRVPFSVVREKAPQKSGHGILADLLQASPFEELDRNLEVKKKRKKIRRSL